MSDDNFFENECARMSRDVYLDTLRANEYKINLAKSLKGVDIKSVIRETELSPKPRKKPFRMRLREFIERIKNTL